MMERFASARIFAGPGQGHTVVIYDAAREDIKRTAAIMAPLETGGVLVGRTYPLDTGEIYTVIEKALPPPPDSCSRCGEFERGEIGLNERLNELAKEGFDYLGEWHTHGSGDLDPSQIDDEAMRKLAADPGAFQPNPVLVIAHAVAVTRPEAGEVSITIYPSGEKIRLAEAVPA